MSTRWTQYLNLFFDIIRQMKIEEKSVPVVDADLASIFQREIPPEVQPLIHKSHFVHWPTAYSSRLIDAFTSEKVNKGRLIDYPKATIDAVKLLSATESKFGIRAGDLIQGSEVIDLGCGVYPAVRLIAMACGAERYVGLDDCVRNVSHITVWKGKEFRSHILNVDILTGLAQMQPSSKKVFHLAGLEPFELEALSDEQYKDVVYREGCIRPNNREYIAACLQEMLRLSEPGGSIFIGPVTVGFNPEDIGFKAEGSSSSGYRIFIKSQVLMSPNPLDRCI